MSIGTKILIHNAPNDRREEREKMNRTSIQRNFNTLEQIHFHRRTHARLGFIAAPKTRKSENGR